MRQKPVIYFLLHGKIWHKKRLRSAIEATFKDYTLRFFLSQSKGDFRNFSYEAAKEAANYVISIGGDGSAHDTLNGLMDAEQVGLKLPVLGILPHGSGNDFARHMGITKDLSNLRHAIENKVYIKCDVGELTCRDANLHAVSHYFLNIADVGIGGEIAKKLSHTGRWMGAWLTYQWAIVSSLWKYPYPVACWSLDGRKDEGKILAIIVANGSYFGSGLGIAPEASIYDGALNVILIQEISIPDYIRQLPNLRKKIPIRHSELSYHTCHSIEIDGPLDKLPIDMDGEWAGYTPAKISIKKGAITFLHSGKTTIHKL